MYFIMIANINISIIIIIQYTGNTASHWVPQCHRGRRRPRNTWKRDLEKDKWAAGFRYTWKKMEATSQDRTG